MIGKRMVFILAGDHLLNLAAYFMPLLQPLGEKVLQRENTPGTLEIFSMDGAADGRLVYIQSTGCLCLRKNTQVTRATAEKGLLCLENQISDGKQGLASLGNTLLHPFQLFFFLF